MEEEKNKMKRRYEGCVRVSIARLTVMVGCSLCIFVLETP